MSYISFKDNFEIENEAKVKKGENITLKNTIILSEKAGKTVCEIIKDNGGYGTGFLCKIKINNDKESLCLLSNNHVITKYMLENKNYIEIKLNNYLKKISLNISRRIWTDEKIDFSCIEILKEDNIDINNPFEIDENCYNINYDIKEYNERGIIIPSIGLSKEIELSQGIIYYLKNINDMFFHNCNTEGGFSGGAIILVNNLKIMGMHKGYDKQNKKNVGIYIKKILENLNEEKRIYRTNSKAIQTMKYLQQEFENLQKDEFYKDYKIELNTNYKQNSNNNDNIDIFHWKFRLFGIEGTPYEGGTFLLTADFNEDYPQKEPEIHFITKIYHPLICPSSGHALYRLIKRGGDMKDVIASIEEMLLDYDKDIIHGYSMYFKYIDNTDLLYQKAREYTQKYAK